MSDLEVPFEDGMKVGRGYDRLTGDGGRILDTHRILGTPQIHPDQESAVV
jgi:hypothetical protein